MVRCNRLLSSVALSLLLSIIFFGCSGGGGSEQAPPPSRSPSIQATPSTFIFDNVTPGNSAVLHLEIKNIGTANLNVSGISLVDNNNFKLGSGTGSNPCNAATQTITPGSSCTVDIKFLPANPERFEPYATALVISSNDPKNSILNVLLSGGQEAISALNLRINKAGISCDNVVTAYVSVTDQRGYSVTGLTRNHFTVNGPAGYEGQPTSAPFVDNAATLSAALVLDYSTSITDFPDKVSYMKRAANDFVNELGTDDEAEIIKFGGQRIDLVQSFTSDKNLLWTAINNPWDNSSGTLLYEAAKVGVDNVALSQKDRKAVIVMSDGQADDSGFGDLVASALSNKVPIFAIGIGDNVDVSSFAKMAHDTGGKYYDATTSDYQQLADAFFHRQYILTYTSGLAAGVTDNTTITVTLPSVPAATDIKEITRPAICP